jgi:Rod binding domain-containing protein
MGIGMNLGTTPTAGLVKTMAGLGTDTRTSNAASALDEAKRSKDMKRIEEAAQDFEATFISEMLKPMFEMVEVNDTFGGGKGEEVFRDFTIQEYGKLIARQGGIGISDQIKAQMIKMQGMDPSIVPATPNNS